MSKRHYPSKWWLEPLPEDARDPDIVRAKQLLQRDRDSSRRAGKCDPR